MSEYRIISFDGGGLKGLLTLGMMERISEKLGSREWIEKADMYAGTSTGGLIALGLASGLTLDKIKSFYEDTGPLIFNRNTPWYYTSVFRTLHTGYKSNELLKYLEEVFGSRRLSDLEKEVLVISFDLMEKVGKRKSWAPKIFHNVAGKGQDTELVRAVASYTTAAPTYLPSENGYVDGGVCANNPSMCALAQMLDERNAENKQMNISDLRMLSFGTGVDPKSIDSKNVKWGIFGWNVKLLEIIMDGAVGIADYQCRQILSNEQYKRIQVILNKDIEMDNAAALPELKQIAASIDDKVVEDWADWIKANW